jgi:hypothetical protein
LRIRHVTTWDADAALVKPAIARGLLSDWLFAVTPLGPLGLTPGCTIPKLTSCALARNYDDTTIVLDHLGSPLRVESASKKGPGVCRLERFHKTSGQPSQRGGEAGGLGTSNCGFGFTNKPSLPRRNAGAGVEIFIETCIAAFGPERCMFGKPVDKISCGYHILWNAFKRLAAGMSDGERSSLNRGAGLGLPRENL